MMFLIPSVIVFYCRGHPLDQPLLFGCPQLALYLAVKFFFYSLVYCV